MQTSFFGNIKSLKGRRIVSIAYSQPPRWKGEVYEKLRPLSIMRLMNYENMEAAYRKYLDTLNPVEVFKDLKDAVLVSWEKPGEPSHRRIVAEWLKTTIGVDVPEVGVKQKEIEQSLF